MDEEEKKARYTVYADFQNVGDTDLFEAMRIAVEASIYEFIKRCTTAEELAEVYRTGASLGLFLFDIYNVE